MAASLCGCAGALSADPVADRGGSQGDGVLVGPERLDGGVHDGGVDDLPELDHPDPPDPRSCAPLSPCSDTCVDLTSDPQNCGQCGRTCVVPRAQASCVEGACAVGSCDVGYFDEDGALGNGCEVERLCIRGQPCATPCGGAGRTVCSGEQPTCVAPSETCNAIDDDCDGACDEGPVPFCRVGVHRGVGDGHVYSTDLALVQTPPYNVEHENFFQLYTETRAGMRPVFLCPKGNGHRFLSSDNACELGRAPEATLGFWASSPLCGSTPLYRLYRGANDDHFYTTSAAERDNAVVTYGYLDEGIVGHVWESP